MVENNSSSNYHVKTQMGTIVLYADPTSVPLEKPQNRISVLPDQPRDLTSI